MRQQAQRRGGGMAKKTKREAAVTSDKAQAATRSAVPSGESRPDKSRQSARGQRAKLAETQEVSRTSSWESIVFSLCGPGVLVPILSGSKPSQPVDTDEDVYPDNPQVVPSGSRGPEASKVDDKASPASVSAYHVSPGTSAPCRIAGLASCPCGPR